MPVFDLQKIVTTLRQEFDARLFDPNDSLQGNDVDIWIASESVSPLLSFLQQQDFVCEQTKYSLIARRFHAGALEVLDLIFSKTYLTSLFFGVQIQESAMERILHDRQLERALRYVLLRRKDPVSKEWLSQNLEAVAERYDFNSLISLPIFTQDKTVTLNIQGKITLTIGLIARLWKRIGTGRVIAVTGPDGAGKSTIINAIKSHFDVRVMYMGDWGFRGQKLYDRIMAGPRVFQRLVYPFFYLENWMRLLQAWFYTFCGRCVITDRYPGTNRHLAKKESLYRLNNFLYAFFPQADQFVIITAPIDVIYKRKQELNPAEIELLLKRLRQKLPKQKTTEIVNIDLNDSLNAFLKILYPPETQGRW